MLRNLAILSILAIVVALPFLFRRGDGPVEKTDRTLVIITPHHSALRYEFGLGFQEWYFQKTGELVSIDWRIPGGTQDIVRYVDSVYANSFKLHWERDLGREWSVEVQNAFENRMSRKEPQLGTLDYEVKQAILNSNISCGIDIFMGGGQPDIELQARKGQIVPSGIFKRHPTWFYDDVIPQNFAGNNLWDEQQRWVGTALSGFGIISNSEVLKDLGVQRTPTQWVDLTNPKLLGEVALTDPTASGAFTKAFEIILQQQMQEQLRRLGPGALERKGVEEGWLRGLTMIQQIAANARYFTDDATKPVLAVSQGNCAVGMAIDFYGLFQEENLKNRSGSQRFNFIMPKGGSAVSPDPIAVFRGAKNRDLALDFIEYILSIEGQKLWDYKIGVPGGPKQYALSRAPIRKELFEPQHLPFRSNPDLNLYRDVADFVYHPEWTGGLFNELRFVIRVAFIDAHKELVAAWKAILNARQEGRAEHAKLGLEVMQDLDLIDYAAVQGNIKETLRSGDPLDAIKLQSRITREFRSQYQRAQAIAEGKGYHHGAS